MNAFSHDTPKPSAHFSKSCLLQATEKDTDILQENDLKKKGKK